MSNNPSHHKIWDIKQKKHKEIFILVRRRAMNLIELLVVIVIIAILLALLLGSLNLARANAIRIQCFNNLKQLTFASLHYSMDFFTFPAYVSRRPYSDYLTGRMASSSYLSDEVLRCPGIVHWRGQPYNRLRVYGIYEVDPADPSDAALDIRAGKFWKYSFGTFGDNMLFYFERVRSPAQLSLWRDCIITDPATGEKPHWKYRRTISDNYGAKLSHLRRSAGGYVDGHVESKNLSELHDEPLKMEAMFNVSGEVEEFQ